MTAPNFEMELLTCVKWRYCTFPIAEFTDLTASDGIEWGSSEAIGNTTKKFNCLKGPNNDNFPESGIQAFICHYFGRCGNHGAGGPPNSRSVGDGYSDFFRSNQPEDDKSPIKPQNTHRPPLESKAVPKECPQCYLRVCNPCWDLMRFSFGLGSHRHFFAFDDSLHDLPSQKEYNEYLYARLRTEKRKDLRAWAQGGMEALREDDLKELIEKLHKELKCVEVKKEKLEQRVRDLEGRVHEQLHKIESAVEVLKGAGTKL